MLYKLYSDGGARGNPGPAAAAYVVFSSANDLIDFDARYLGVSTNNIAEYQGLLMGLQRIENSAEVEIYMDSELIVKQIKREYRVKDAKLLVFYQQVISVLQNFARFSIKHIPRSENHLADKLVNIALDAAQHEKN